MTTKDLVNSIEKATTTQELRNIVDAIPLQANGERTQIAYHLGDTFWYVDLTTVEQQKSFMLKTLSSYPTIDEF